MYQMNSERHIWGSAEEVIDSRETVKVSDCVDAGIMWYFSSHVSG